MSDIVDDANAIEAEHLAYALTRVSVVVPAGTAGVCAECDEQMDRLIAGRCGFCRDGRTPPPGFFERRDAARAAAPFTPPEEEATVMPEEPNRKITIEGDALAAIESRAHADDISFKQATSELVLLGAARVRPVAELPGGPLSIADVDELLDELRARFNLAASTPDLQGDLNAALARADLAEKQLARVQAALSGTDA